MTRISNRIERMHESATLMMAQLSRNMRKRGIDIVDLSLGEPDFDTPEYIVQAAIKGMSEGYTHYPPVAGYEDLKEAICTKFKRDNNFIFEMDQIVVSTGAKQSLANLLFSLVNPGDEVLIPAPYWVTYDAQIRMVGGISKVLPSSIEDDFKISPSQLESGISDKTKVFLFSSPCNPSGSVYSKEELTQLASVFERHPNVFIISDEIYELINFEGKHESIYQFESLRDRVAIVNGLSKGFAMTGWRLGYIAAPREVASACTKMQGQITSGTCTISQRAAIEALTTDYSTCYQMQDILQKRKDLMFSELDKIPELKVNHPKGAFYLFPNASAYFGKKYKGEIIKDADTLSMAILKYAHVALVSGTAFGNDNCFRISYALDEVKIKEAGKRLQKFFNSLA